MSSNGPSSGSYVQQEFSAQSVHGVSGKLGDQGFTKAASAHPWAKKGLTVRQTVNTTESFPTWR